MSAGRTLLDAYDVIVQSDDYTRGATISASMIGGCRRQGAYALTVGWPTENMERGGMATAHLGHAIHEYLLPKLQQALGGEVEAEVTGEIGGIEVSGHVDLLTDEVVVDVKTVSDNYYSVVARNTPKGHRLQATAYAMLTKRERAVLLYVNRGTGDRFSVEWHVEDYASDVLAWIQQVQVDPEWVERDERGPGLSIICDSCPFAGPCWGPVSDEQFPQGVLVNERGVEMAVENYVAARDQAKKADEDKEFWRKTLEGAPVGEYGAWRLRWKGQGGFKDVPDPDAMYDRLVELGEDIPLKQRRLPRSIDVAPVPPEPAP